MVTFLRPREVDHSSVLDLQKNMKINQGKISITNNINCAIRKFHLPKIYHIDHKDLIDIT